MTLFVDEQDAWLIDILPWRISTKGYVEATMYDGAWRATVKLHHFIMGCPIWEEDTIDHINQDKLDNRRSNLRWTTVYMNAQNREYVKRAKHVRLTRQGKYEARIQRNGVVHQVGTFATEQEAYDALREFRIHSQL